MAQHKSPWNGLKTALLILALFLFFTVLPFVTSAFTTSLSIALRSIPLFSMTTLFALLLAVLFRLQFITEIPQKTLGVLVDRHDGTFKTLLPPAAYWINPRSERVKACLSLEPSSLQMSLLKLQASDGEAPAQVVIAIWRVRADMDVLLLGLHGLAVQMMAMKSHQQQEYYVRGAVKLIFSQVIQQRTVSQVKDDLEDTLGRPLQTAAAGLLNTYLTRVGLQVDQIELVGATTAAAKAAAPSKSAQEARKLLAEVQRKLKLVLPPATPPVTQQYVAQYIWQAYQTISKARSEINEVSDAMNRYVGAVSDTFDQLSRQAKQRPDLTSLAKARQESFDRLKLLQDDVYALGQHLIALDQQASRLPLPPFDLTPAESNQLLDLLDAIDHQKIKLDDL